MLATTRRSRTRRPSRFAPAVDALSSRILLSDLLGSQTHYVAPPPEELPPVDREMVETVRRFDRLCTSGAEQI